ncbi:PQQ-binding-like beta-propeller repeat protein [Streptomyces sp. NPDC047453]|uniref:outer membrane protein assembly factor BamB family protein n=1 Tax=Streptomyces sp. NPDC047453 TaxID=3154812 RepID=UPI00340D814B
MVQAENRGGGSERNRRGPSRRALVAGAVSAATGLGAGAWLFTSCQRDTGSGKGEPGSKATPPSGTAAPDTAPSWPINITFNTAPPAFEGDTLYCAEYGGRVRAFDAISGRERWRFTPPREVSLKKDVQQSTPLLGDGLVVTGRWGRSSAVFALEAATGTLLWSRQLSGSLSSCTRWKDLVIYADQNPSEPPDIGTGHVYAVRATTGKPVWEISVPATQHLIPLDDSLLIKHIDQIGHPDSGWDGQMRAVDPRTGRSLWRSPVEMSNPTGERSASVVGYTPIIDGVLLAWFLADSLEQPQLDAWRLSDGALLWTRRGDESLTEPAVGASHNLYVAADGRCIALDARSGREIWSRRRHKASHETPVLHGETLIVPEYTAHADSSRLGTSRLLFLNAATGEMSHFWEQRDDVDIVATEGGVVYASVHTALGNRSELAAIDISSGKQMWVRAVESGNSYEARGEFLYVYGSRMIDRLHARTGKPTR